MTKNFLILTVRKMGDNKVIWVPKKSNIKIGDQVLIIPVDFQKALEWIKEDVREVNE